MALFLLIVCARKAFEKQLGSLTRVPHGQVDARHARQMDRQIRHTDTYQRSRGNAGVRVQPDPRGEVGGWRAGHRLVFRGQVCSWEHVNTGQHLRPKTRKLQWLKVLNKQTKNKPRSNRIVTDVQTDVPSIKLVRDSEKNEP